MGETQTYTQAERERIIARIRAGLERGQRVAVTARELGISQGIFYRWVREQALRAASKASAPPAVSRPPAADTPRRILTGARKQKAIAAIRRRVAAGARVADAARAEGVSPWTYYGWLRWAGKQRAEEAADETPEPALTLRAVAVVPAAPAMVSLLPPAPDVPGPGLVLVVPGGYRLEGLGVASAAELLKALR